MKSYPKIKNWRSRDYLDFIKSKPSLKSGLYGNSNDPIVPSHQGMGRKGTALKSPDSYAIPLLWSEHQACEHQKGGRTFWGNQYDALPLRCLEYVTEFLSTRS